MTRRGILAAIAGLAAAPAAGAVPGQGSKALLVAGQSLSTPYGRADVKAAFVEEMGEPWTIHSVGQGGTSAYNWNPRDPSRSWTVVKEGRIEIGPVLQRALDMLRANPVLASEIWAAWIQGQTDGATWRPELCEEEVFVARYIAAVLFVTRTLREAIRGDEWATIPCLIQFIGWRRDGNGAVYEPHGFTLVRLAQTHLLAKHGARFNLVPGAVQMPWVQLKDSVHPTPEEDHNLARQNAQIIKRRRG